jgi:hypothetical protein
MGLGSHVGTLKNEAIPSTYTNYTRGRTEM